ncbi:hypothetical protein BD769DRAFT_1390095 [Suillus cothurnatus]|nr:hypothetical protein BD769DRAFT_1390095 [Suillus cothurnatus]
MALDCKVGTEADENGKQHGDCLEDSMDHLDSQGSEAQPGVSNDTGGDGDLGEGGHNHDEEAGQQEPNEDYDDNDNNDDSGSGFSKSKKNAAREEAGPEYMRSAHGTYEMWCENTFTTPSF